MYIARNKEKENEYFSAIQQYIVEQGKNRPEGIHVSSLVFPLKAWYDHFYPKPITKKQVGLFFSGQAFEQYFSDTVAGKIGIEPKEWGKWNGIHYEIDFIDKTYNPENTAYLGMPIETKSTRSAHRYKDENKGYKPEIIDNLTSAELEDNFDAYIQQLKKYMIIAWSQKSQLIVFFYNLTISYGKNIAFGKKSPEIRVYDVAFLNNKEMEDEYYNMFSMRDLLLESFLLSESSMTSKNKKLPACPEWLCKSCEHFVVNCNGALAHSSSSPLDF